MPETTSAVPATGTPSLPGSSSAAAAAATSTTTRILSSSSTPSTADANTTQADKAKNPTPDGTPRRGAKHTFTTATLAPTSVSSSTSSSASATVAAPADAANGQSLPQDSESSGEGVFVMVEQPFSQGGSHAIDGCLTLRDGRIRNPIPSKLKGKTDGMKGKFTVMQMDLNNKGEAQEKEAAAKRTSEGIVLAAQMAQNGGKRMPVKRRRLLHPSDTRIPAQADARRGPPGPVETKSEQARLLNLLRALSPTVVVDQLCRAISFFGGIPNAPPPQDGQFPLSAYFNGPGSLLVGWMSEIFPPVDVEALELSQAAQVPSRIQPQPPPSNPVVFPRRGRGRPKGSKTKNRNKTAKKKHDTNADDSWVDLEETALAHGDDDATLAAIAAAAAPHNAHAPDIGSLAALQSSIVSSMPQASQGSHVEPRRRGRPKGSKNKPKGDVLPDPRHDPQVSSEVTAVLSTGPPPPQERRQGPGRPRGSKNKPKPDHSQPPPSRDAVLANTTDDLNGVESRTPLPSRTSPATDTALRANSGSESPSVASRKSQSKRPLEKPDGSATLSADSVLLSTSLENQTSQPPLKRVRRSKPGEVSDALPKAQQIMSSLVAAKSSSTNARGQFASQGRNVASQFAATPHLNQMSHVLPLQAGSRTRAGGGGTGTVTRQAASQFTPSSDSTAAFTTMTAIKPDASTSTFRQQHADKHAASSTSSESAVGTTASFSDPTEAPSSSFGTFSETGGLLDMSGLDSTGGAGGMATISAANSFGMAATSGSQQAANNSNATYNSLWRSSRT